MGLGSLSPKKRPTEVGLGLLGIWRFSVLARACHENTFLSLNQVGELAP